MPSIPPELCSRCKGYKRLCGLPKCPILEGFRFRLNAALSISNKVAEGATPPSGLVGEYGYPKVLFHYMVPPKLRGDEARYRNNPVMWSIKREPLGNIIRFREELVSALLRVNVNKPWELYQSEIGLAIISEKPVDSEIILKQNPLPKLSFDGITKPLGPRAEAERIFVRDNPKLSSAMEKVIWDDLKAESAVWKMYSAGIDVYMIQNMFSLGFLGKIRQRRMVPTRWSITAIDDIISKKLRDMVRDYNGVNDYELYEGEYLSNRFLTILMPGEGYVEWAEVWHPSTVWTMNAKKPVINIIREDPLGRISSMDGGFSAARISLLEFLYRKKKKANAIILREILPSYYAPVGNWHIRETMRNSFIKGAVAKTHTLDEVLLFIRGWMKADAEDIINSLSLLRARRDLTEYLK